MSFTDSPLILIIDDAPEELRALVTLLRAHGFRLSLASEAHQGYQRALALRPDLILLDVHMPQMSGFTLCRLLREAPATQRVPVVFLTSASDIDDRLEGLTLGGVDYVVKPCVAEEVLARIRIHLQRVWREQPAAVSDEPVERLEPDQVILRAAMRLIEQRLADVPGLAEIARQVGTHDKRLSAIFREHLGTTVFAYIREARLRRAQTLLQDSAMSIQDVADLVGFRSACNFTTAFRERLGVTPSQFRQQAGGLDEGPRSRP